MNSVAEVYKNSFDLFEDKSRWAKYYYQYDKQGEKCPIKDGHSYCALGVLQQVIYAPINFDFDLADTTSQYTDLHTKALCCLQRVSEFLYGKHIQVINDNDEDGYNKVRTALKFASEFWKDSNPTSDDIGVSIESILQRRSQVK